MKKVFLLVGESSSGKDSIANLLVERDNLTQLISYTTRPQRVNEGDTHVFIDKHELDQYRDDMVAYTKIGEFEYFATRQQLENSDIYTVDPEGVKFVKSIVFDIDFVIIYVNVKESERKRRAIEYRHDDPVVVEKRFFAEKDQFDEFRLNAEFDYSVRNDDINKSYQIVKNIIDIESNDTNTI